MSRIVDTISNIPAPTTYTEFHYKGYKYVYDDYEDEFRREKWEFEDEEDINNPFLKSKTIIITGGTFMRNLKRSKEKQEQEEA